MWNLGISFGSHFARYHLEAFQDSFMVNFLTGRKIPIVAQGGTSFFWKIFISIIFSISLIGFVVILVKMMIVNLKEKNLVVQTNLRPTPNAGPAVVINNLAYNKPLYKTPTFIVVITAVCILSTLVFFFQRSIDLNEDSKDYLLGLCVQIAFIIIFKVICPIIVLMNNRDMSKFMFDTLLK